MKIILAATADRGDALSIKNLGTFFDYVERLDYPDSKEPEALLRPDGTIRQIRVEMYRS